MRSALVGGALAAVALAACGPSQSPAAETTHGPDLALSARCLSCHTIIGRKWSNPSSHSLLLDCGSCHAKIVEPNGPGHRGKPSCAGCHSAVTHRGLSCGSCHEVHGTVNLYLVRFEPGSGEPVQLTQAQGASPGGLVRLSGAGHPTGAGVCEACHTQARYYLASGKGAAHERGWCAGCHSHEAGFSPGR